MLVGAYGVDRRTREDFAFWGYLFGLLAFWGGLSLLESDSEWNRFLYGLVNLAFILIAVLFQRKVFIVFGTIGGVQLYRPSGRPGVCGLPAVFTGALSGRRPYHGGRNLLPPVLSEY